MSSQRGNVKRTRPQKYKNKSAFKNNLHDKTKATQTINSLSISGVCEKCKGIIDWKIKYKKFKLLSQPKTCVRCHQKAIKLSYCTICEPCASKEGCCAKCGEKKEIVMGTQPTQAELSAKNQEFKRELAALSEKKRRKFLRLLAEGKLDEQDLPTSMAIFKGDLQEEEGDQCASESDESEADKDEEKEEEEEEQEEEKQGMEDNEKEKTKKVSWEKAESISCSSRNCEDVKSDEITKITQNLKYTAIETKPNQSEKCDG